MGLFQRRFAWQRFYLSLAVQRKLFAMHLPRKIPMHINLQRSSENAAISVPAILLRQLQVGVGSRSSRDVLGKNLGSRVVRPKPCHTLASMMAQCDLSAMEPEDMVEWNAMRPVGREG